MRGKRLAVPGVLVLVLITASAATVGAATPTYFSDRPSFEAALTTVVTDDYAPPVYPAGFNLYTNAVMSAFLGETDYVSTGWPDLNIHLPNDTYCAGCNGSFRLSFQTTTQTVGGVGVYGAGVDFLDNQPGLPYVAFITFGDGTTADVPLAAGSGFFGVTAPELVESVHFGLAGGGSTQEGNLFIDNLTIGAGAQVLDFGDLPPAYGLSLLVEDGARHSVTGLAIGTCVDGEADGQPHANALGDDLANTGCADDEGAVVPAGNWTDGDGHLDLIGGISGNGCLNVWLDFTDGATATADGDFGDSLSGVAEWVVVNLEVTAATTSVTFPLPVGIDTSGQVYFARTRLTPRDTTGGCSAMQAYLNPGGATPTGSAIGGMVVDTQVIGDSVPVELRSLTLE
ncbi:MAG TPA: hypothetical protein VLT32_08860 [Candidatus Sulfomarinibacteraceae bacterium]|nr:hypothetical protein [Candidatus Sulfomarinibacteraceae bacterium]